jgi:6-phosphogluconolactonase (cycloisomerase 2 family)
MDLNKMGRVAMASVASLAMVCGLTSCSRDYTLAYLYVTTQTTSGGEVLQYSVDYQTGAVVPFGTPATAGSNPVASVAAQDAKFIYVVNQGSSTVQPFAVADTGELTAGTAVATGSTPTAVAIDALGKFLYVTYTYQSGFSASNPGPGGVSIVPINSDGSLGTPTNVNVGYNPVGAAITNFNATLYVLDQEAASAHPQVLAFTENTTTGALTPVAGTTTTTGFAAGVVPSAIAEDPTGRFVYVTDEAANQLIGYVVQAGGGLLAMVDGPFSTGLYPVSVTVDPRGRYVYVTNYNAHTISGYMLNTSTGTPSGVSGTTASTDPNPVAITIEPALGIYMFTANNLASTITGEKLNANTGALTQIQNSPYPAQGIPSSVVAVANGSHPTQALFP